MTSSPRNTVKPSAVQLTRANPPETGAEIGPLRPGRDSARCVALLWVRQSVMTH